MALRALAFALVFGLSAPAYAHQHALFDPAKDPSYGDPAAVARAYLHDRRPVLKKPQHFCVLGMVIGEDHIVYVHWVEGKHLILWEPRDGEDAPNTLRLSRRDWDLKKDVVPTDDDINGSTYLVSRPWVDAQLAECRDGGHTYVVKP